jgi:hypothetical protein
MQNELRIYIAPLLSTPLLKIQRDAKFNIPKFDVELFCFTYVCLCMRLLTHTCAHEHWWDGVNIDITFWFDVFAINLGIIHLPMSWNIAIIYLGKT